jgi:hypothetical protein
MEDDMRELIMQIEATSRDLPTGPPALEIHRLDGGAEAARVAWPTLRCCAPPPAPLG